ncbi:purine catabolism regulatory protein [Caloramator fervidus]|uniref:Purine catabolism regulatory protein n=1 Tax=Caloramator fervidus TaxID=29344 RepID=A0A1H5RWN7_9CLOT|nr:PucR family transcriptional regulator ligand-binding domain-containing protein [Caloramator fervidus]SEF41921.1 purine catabolism regulatory protein [Caloramator fervidus]
MARQNGVTIEDILKMDCMKNCKLIAGYSGIKNVVSRVNIMADPDILNWVSEGEFLLTTAHALTADVEFQKKFILSCSQKKLSGLGIKIYPYLEKLDDEVIELAENLSFPIIELYYLTPFSEIMTPIFKEIFNKQTILLQRLEKVHEDMMNIMLKGGSIEDIINVVYENVKNPVILKLNYPEKTIFKIDMLEENIREKIKKNFDEFYLKSKEKISEKRFYETVEKISGKNITRMVMPIVVKEMVYGHIFSWAVITPLGGFDLSVLEIAATTMAVEILKLLSLRESENVHKIEFVEDLCSTDEKRLARAISNLSIYNFKEDDFYCYLIIKIRRNYKKFDFNFISDSVYLLNLLEDILHKNNINGIVVGKKDQIDILLCFKKDENFRKKINFFKDEVLDIFNKKIFIEYMVGFGRCYKGVENIKASFKEAQKAIKAIDILKERNVVFYENLGIYKLLCSDEIADELKDFYKTTIEALEDYDRKKSTEFVKTLKAYFECNGNLKKMSEVLYTHYNTILYRLQRIKQITGLDVEKENDRISLHLALKIKDIIK